MGVLVETDRPLGRAPLTLPGDPARPAPFPGGVDSRNARYRGFIPRQASPTEGLRFVERCERLNDR